jgi:MFS family permease
VITPTPSATPITPNAVLASFAGFSAAWMVLMATRYYALQASDINGALNVGFDTGSWLSTAYAVCEPIGVVIGAWLGIALALRRMLLMGVATFLIGSTLPLMVKGYDALMVSRIITGLAGGAIMPQSIIIQLRTWGPTRIPLALALFLSAPTAATLLGGLVGAWGVQHFDWSFVLWAALPPGMLQHPVPRMRAFTCFLALGGIAFAMSAQAQVPTDPTQVRPLAVGVHAPLFSGTRTDGTLRVFKPDGYARPAIVIFYRGGWCPYWNMQLSDLRLVEPKLRAL